MSTKVARRKKNIGFKTKLFLSIYTSFNPETCSQYFTQSSVANARLGNFCQISQKLPARVCTVQ
jgi:hypothetical protein